MSCFVRRGDLLLAFVNTMWSGLGDGRMETDWLNRTLAGNSDAGFKLALGHHLAHPINGFSGDYQRSLDADDRREFASATVAARIRSVAIIIRLRSQRSTNAPATTLSRAGKVRQAATRPIIALEPVIS
ncbi:MAG: hypothetical protein Q8P50_07370 [Bacillota bacterium]|nr:hypothetical protein [Bacillota bacterium]